jgi:hypothetical protein
MVATRHGFVVAGVLPMLAHSVFVRGAWSSGPTDQPSVGGHRTVASTLMRAVGVADTVEHFAGALYGVSADVALNMNTRVAHVTLRGYPIAGTVEGDGWLKEPDKERGEVVLEPTFAARLARRFVFIQWASLDREKHTVTVHVSVPLLGECELVLKGV